MVLPEWHLQVLPAPDVHPLVIGANLVEVVPDKWQSIRKIVAQLEANLGEVVAGKWQFIRKKVAQFVSAIKIWGWQTGYLGVIFQCIPTLCRGTGKNKCTKEDPEGIVSEYRIR